MQKDRSTFLIVRPMRQATCRYNSHQATRHGLSTFAITNEELYVEVSEPAARHSSQVGITHGVPIASFRCTRLTVLKAW